MTTAASSIPRSSTAPIYTWPQGKRLAFYVALNMEHFSYGEGLGISMSPVVYCVSLHAFIVGQPYRLRHLRRALSHICKHRDKLWIATGGEIASYFAESVPAKSSSSET